MTQCGPWSPEEYCQPANQRFTIDVVLVTEVEDKRFAGNSWFQGKAVRKFTTALYATTHVEPNRYFMYALTMLGSGCAASPLIPIFPYSSIGHPGRSCMSQLTRWRVLTRFYWPHTRLPRDLCGNRATISRARTTLQGQWQREWEACAVNRRWMIWQRTQHTRVSIFLNICIMGVDLTYHEALQQRWRGEEMYRWCNFKKRGLQDLDQGDRIFIGDRVIVSQVLASS